MATLKYGLNLSKKASGGLSPKRKRLFDDDDSDDNGAGVLAGAPTSKKASNLATRLTVSKQSSSALATDAAVYDYDATWEAQNAVRQQKKAAERAAAVERKPRYMASLLATAEVRKRDELRAKDKQLQKEREMEGEEFADKESFVTGAYKKQQEEVRRQEEEERAREEEERKKGGGLGRLYRGLLDDREREHEELEEAVRERLKADPEEEEREREKKREREREGVVVNDEGEIVDKRQLLTAGLNVQRKARPEDKKPVATEARKPESGSYAGRNATREAARERQSRMLEAQLEQAAKRAAEEEEEQRKTVVEAAQSKRATTDVQSARERYLARKKAAEGK